MHGVLASYPQTTFIVASMLSLHFLQASLVLLEAALVLSYRCSFSWSELLASFEPISQAIQHQVSAQFSLKQTFDLSLLDYLTTVR